MRLPERNKAFACVGISRPESAFSIEVSDWHAVGFGEFQKSSASSRKFSRKGDSRESGIGPRPFPALAQISENHSGSSAMGKNSPLPRYSKSAIPISRGNI